MSALPGEGRVPWAGIAVFYAVALAVAAPFNLGLADGWLRQTFPGTPLATWTFLPAALGPAIGAMVARRMGGRTPRLTTALGTDATGSLLVAILPVVVFTAIGGAGLVLPVIALLYAFGEELGWRGYLADALGPWPAAGRYGLTAFLWWPWHLRFETTFDWVVFPVIVLASSVVIGHAARTSRSVLVAAAMHAMVIMMTVGGPPTRPLAIAGGLTLAGWIAVGKLREDVT